MNATALETRNTTAATPARAQTAAYDIDSSHSSASFKVRHLMVANVRGELGLVTGEVFIDEQDLTRSWVKASIDATAISTRDERRDAHLRSPDFFDVQTYPTITFQSRRVKPGRDGAFEVTGDLTIRGVTRETTLSVEPLTPEVRDPYGNTKRGVSATAKIDRKDFGVSWNGALDGGGVLVGDEVAVTLEIELNRRA